MSTTSTPESGVLTLEEKTRDLCQYLLETPAYAAAQGCIEAFQEDKEAQTLYRAWQQKAAELHHMQHEGKEPSDADIVEVEQRHEAVMDNSVANDFVEAEDALNGMFSMVMKTVQKTLQDGRVPTEDELNECCGNSGCGCN